MSELTTGGSNAALPDNWVTPNGFPLTKAMLWTGKEPATDDDIADLKKKGFDPEPSTLVGILDPKWDAKQYRNQKVDELEDGESVPRFGGLGSWAYQSQYLPDEIERMLPPKKWCVMLNGEMHRTAVYTPVKKVSKGEGHWECHELDYSVEWNAGAKLWTLV